MIEEKRIITLEKKIEHLHEVLNIETDAIEENIKLIIKSIESIVPVVNMTADVVNEIQEIMFVNDEDHVPISSPKCAFAVSDNEEIDKSYV